MRKSYILLVFVSVIAAFIPLRNAAQEASGERALDERSIGGLYPEYRIEIINKPDDPRDVFLPFVHSGYLYIFSLGQKRPVWRIFIGGDLVNPFALDGTLLCFYDIYNRLYEADILKGEMLWKAEIKDEIRGRPLVYKDYVVVSTQRGSLLVLNSRTGGIVDEYTGSGGISAGITIYENFAIIPFKNGRISAFDLDKRREAWEFNSGGIISVAPVVRDGILFFGDWDDAFYALDARTGEQIWVSSVGEDVARDFVLLDSSIILFFSRGEIQCLDSIYGEIKWVKYFNDVEFSFNYFQGLKKLYIFTPELIALDADDGKLLFNYKERAFALFKEMLFESMIEGEVALTDEDRSRLLSTVYFSVDSYPLLPPVVLVELLAYFVTEESYLYVYDLKEDFFIIRYKLG